MTDGADLLRRDARRLARWAAKYGALLALACHLMPHHLHHARAICDALAALCTGG